MASFGFVLTRLEGLRLLLVVDDSHLINGQKKTFEDSVDALIGWVLGSWCLI